MTGIDIISRVSSGKLGHQAGWSVGSLHLKLLSPGPGGQGAVQSSLWLRRQAGPCSLAPPGWRPVFPFC